jgi:FMN phosphatase YigB (HAD superfamily)
MRTEGTHERTIKAVFFDLFGTLLRLGPLDSRQEHSI